MTRKRMILTLVAIGAAVGVIMGRYAGATWWTLIVVICVVVIAGFLLRLLAMQRVKEAAKKKS